jgi:hypothetical protein
MPNESHDPILDTLHFASHMIRYYMLEDFEAAVYSAAFVLFGPPDYGAYAAEAAYYLKASGGRVMNASVEATIRRTQAGMFGTKRTSVESL